MRDRERSAINLKSLLKIIMEQYDKEPDVKLHELLKKLIELNGSDLHLTTGTPPQVRIDGEMTIRPLVATILSVSSIAYCPMRKSRSFKTI